MKILITGGHLTPALALMEYLQEKQPSTEIVFVGRPYSQESSVQKSQEETEVTQLGAMFVPLTAPRLERDQQKNIFSKVTPFVKSTLTAISILRKQRPDCYLSFGGYLATPVAIAAWICRIPIITHEQTHSLGLANKLIARIATRIALSHQSSETFLSPKLKKKSVVIGNLLRPSLWQEVTAPTWLPEKNSLPILFITGGNQGSQMINQTVGRALPQLTKNWLVIHQCGAATSELNYEQYLQTLANQLPATQKRRYFVKPWITAHQLAWIYQHTSLVISRAGANTIDEISAFNIPAIIIPLPFAYQQEQNSNAQALKLSKPTQTKVIQQKDCTAATLIKAVVELKPQTAATKRELHPPLQPLDEMLQLLTEVCH